jgi:hypothetical protein
MVGLRSNPNPHYRVEGDSIVELLAKNIMGVASMIHRRVVRFATATVVFFELAFSCAQSRTDRTIVQDPIVVPFNLASDRLPPRFSGHSIVSIFQAVSKRPELLKSESETVAQYHARITNLGGTRLVGDLPLNGEIAFLVTCDSSEPNEDCERYDAEKGTLSVLLPDNSADPEGVKLYRKLAAEYPQGFHSSPAMTVTIQVREEHGPRIPDGIAENGFGAKFAVSKQSVTRYFIDSLIPEWFSLAASKPLAGELNPSVDISLDPQTAMRAKGAVRELIIGHLSPPYLGESRIRWTAQPALIQSVPPCTSGLYTWTLMRCGFSTPTGEVYRKIRSGERATQ